MIARRFRSPLLGTILVLLALALLAVPLHRLTARGEESGRETRTETAAAAETTRAVLRVRVLDALKDMEIRTTEDQLLYRQESMEPGETEVDVEILLEHNEAELRFQARAGDKDTAVFITLLPDGHEERTAYAIGAGIWEDTLHFHWEHE